jgi:hypothetical protein
MEYSFADFDNINYAYLITFWNTACLIYMRGLLKLQVCVYSI